MDLRPQAHDIIRTWLFDTVLRAHLEHDSLPWTNAAISGWVLDPDRKKMSKSKGNVVTPMALLEEHGSDGVRYWAASGRPGTDTAFDTGQMKVGPPARDQAAERVEVRARAARAAAAPITAPVDRGDADAAWRALVRRRDRRPRATTTTRACSQRTETFFWRFCDDYLELVKGAPLRRSGAEARPRRPTRALHGRALGRCCGCSRRSCRS